MSRLTREQLEMIKARYKVDALWSYSKLSTHSQCSWAYFLKYVKKIRVDGANCYNWWGSEAHEIMQNWYDGKYENYSDMSKALEEAVTEFGVAKVKNPKIAFKTESEFASYIANLRHYFANTNIIPFKVINERPILAEFNGIKKYVFQGYIDSEFFDEDGNFVIMDYKTSTISGFTGSGLIDKSKQLIIYAIGVSQLGRNIDGKYRKIPIEKIKIRYDMMKYVNITFMQKNGTLKTTKAERRLWVAHMTNNIRKDLEGVEKDVEKIDKEIAKLAKKMGAKKRTEDERIQLGKEIEELEAHKAEVSKNLYDIIQINEMVEEAISNNNLDNMPQFIQDKYKVENCYIDVELNQELVDKVTREITENLNVITEKSKMKNLEESFVRGRIEANESFYCTNLCDMREHCSFFKELKEHNSMFLSEETMSDEDMLKLLGL